MEEYRNVLANKFMRDTNYIIIKDTDDLEELERQWELFQSSLTVRQQRLSDDRSIQIWNMTNQQHYEYQKIKLMDELRNKLDIEDEEPISIEYEPEEDDDEKINDDEITNFVNMSFDDFEIPDDENNINEPIKEDSIIPTDGKELNEKQKLNDEIKADMNKDAQADQYEIDSNINIIGYIKGFTPQERLDNLEKAFRDWNSQNQDHRKKSDDKCREIYGMSNIDRYNKIKGSITKTLKPEKDDVKGNSNTNTTNDIKSLGEFVSMVYSNMQVVNESESNANKQHRRLNDTPYFTPSEMIDMGVHGNDNYYCPVADNDGLITNIRIPTWFSSYKDMCMDHIFEDYTKDWIDTLDHLYSDFEQIKESGDENKIAARKQSILDLGWNPEIPFTRRNRQLASKRVSKLLDKSSPLNIFINLDKEVPDSDVTNEPVVENAHKNTHQPVYIVFVQGSKGLLVPDAIRVFTNSDYTHVGMSFDSSLKDIHTYNITANPGIVRETLSRYQDNVISVMAFFAPTEIYNNMKDEVMDHYINARKSIYDLTAIANKVVKKNTRLINNKYHQICSTFVDTILKSGQIDITKDNNLPDPGQLYNITKSMPNKIIEVYNGPASGYNAEEVNKKMNKLLKDGIKAIDETTDITSQIKLVQATQSDTENMYNWEMESIDKSLQSDSKVISCIKQDVQESIKDTKMITYNNKTIGMLTCCYIDNGEWWYIGEIYLIPEYRNKGIGTKLIKEQIQSHNKIKLQVAYNNKGAIKLYKSLGFKIVDKNDKGKMYIMALDKKNSLNEETSIKDKYKSKIRDYKLEKYAKQTDFMSNLFKYDYAKSEYFKMASEALRNKKDVMYRINDMDNSESNDIYHNIEDWESGKSNVLWVTGLSGSGKSTISKEISTKYNDVEYVELDLIQAGKIKQWDDNDKRLNGLLKDFVKYKGGFDNIFPSYTQKARKGELNFGDMMDKSCADQFNELFEYIITYTKKNSNRRFVIEGVQIAMCTSNKMIEKISEYPVIIKMNGPLKTEFRREKRSIKSHIDQDMDFITTFKHVCHHIQTWVKNGFFLNNWKELNYFRTHIGESASVLNEVKQFPVEFDQDGNLIIYKARIGSIAYGDEIDDSVKLLESYRNTNNIEGMKYELAKLWFINDSIEKKLKKRLTNEQYKELINNRATCLNVFKLNLEYVMKAEKGFNFSDYYNSTPFSDNSVKITANTLKYSMKAIASMI